MPSQQTNPTQDPWLEISGQESFSSLTEEFQAIRRTLEMYANARPRTSHEENEEIDDSELEQEQEEGRRNRNRHLRPLSLPEQSLSQPESGLFSGNRRVGTGLADGRRRTIVRSSQPSRLSQALSASDESNRYQLILNDEAPLAVAGQTEEQYISDWEDAELIAFFNDESPFDFDELPASEVGSQRTFIRRVMQPQANGFSWLLAEIRQAGNWRRRSRLSTMTSANEEDRSAHDQISTALQRLESQQTELIAYIQRNQGSRERLLDDDDEEATPEDGVLSDTTVTPSSAVLLSDSVVDSQVRFMLRLQRLQEQIGTDSQGEVGDRDRFQLPTSEERHTFQRLSRTYEDSFNQNEPSLETSRSTNTQVLPYSRPDPTPPMFLPLDRRTVSTKLVMARSKREQMRSKEVSWVREGVRFRGRLVIPPAREANLRDRYNLISNLHRECVVDFRIRQVDTDRNRISCILNRKPGTIEAEELWEGEMLEGPYSLGEEEDDLEVYKITSHWQQLYPNHTLNGTSMLWKMQDGSGKTPCALEYASPKEMQAKASREYVWLLLRESVRDGDNKNKSQLFLSVRRSDGVVEGCMDRKHSGTLLMFLRPEGLSARGGYPDISRR